MPHLVDGHDAPITLSLTTYARQDEGLQYIPDAETQQAPISSPENNDARRQSIPWETHPRRSSVLGDNLQGSIVQDIESRRNSETNAIPTHSSLFRRQGTVGMSGISEDAPPDSYPSTVGRQELSSQGTRGSAEMLHPKDIISEKSPSRLGRSLTRSFKTRSKHWRWLLPIAIVILILLAILVTFVILYTRGKRESTSAPDLNIIMTTPSFALPSLDSALSAATLYYSRLLPSPSITPSPTPTTLLAYTTSNNSICIRTYTSAYLTPVQCITNLPLKPHTPLTILDWYGGPSIYYLTSSNHINGLDSVPENNTWVPSSVNTQPPTSALHASSQLTSVTWCNGSSAWLYYVDTTLQLREYGLLEARDDSWQLGANGPLGLASEGSGIGASRYIDETGEVLEVFIQTDNNALHGRKFSNNVWDADFYAVDGTTTGLNPQAAVTAATVNGSVSGTLGADVEENVLLVWVNSNGFVNVQTRGTGMGNDTALNAFSAPQQLPIEGDGGTRPGLTATGTEEARVWFMDGQKIWDLWEKGTNWTYTDVTSL